MSSTDITAIARRMDSVIFGLDVLNRTVERRQEARLQTVPPSRASRAAPDLSARTELYRHFDSAGQLLYVGISLSTAARLSAHMALSQWATHIATITVERHETRAAALAAEATAILEEAPLWNIAGKPKEPAREINVAEEMAKFERHLEQWAAKC